MTPILWDSVAVSQEGLSSPPTGRPDREKRSHAKDQRRRAKETAKIQKTTYLLQRSFRQGTQRINRGFDLMLNFQKNLNDDQKKNGIR
jgi:hypothetical protein